LILQQQQQLVLRAWTYCNTLRDDGVSYGDYVEQLTYLLFLKMADEYSKPPYNRNIQIPKKLNWESLKGISGEELEAQYIKILNELGKEKGMIGEIFFKAQNKIQDPAKLYKLIQMIDDDNWVILGADVKGDIYEVCLRKMPKILNRVQDNILLQELSSKQWLNV